MVLLFFGEMGVDLDVVFSDKNMIVALVYSDPPDLGFIGPSFTWSNRREGLTNIRERLDRVCVIKVGRLDSPRLGLDIFVTLIQTII